MAVETIELEAFHALLKAQGVARTDIAFECPMCRTVQSMRSLIRAGAGEDEAAVEKYIGFSCVGRFTDAGPPDSKMPPGRGCNWSLGGLFQTHKMAVRTPEGVVQATFAPATPEAAQALAASWAA
jgi:hypothetical protein